MQKPKFIYVIGAEGCGHHGFFPMLTTSITAYEKERLPPDEAVPLLGRWAPLRRIFNYLWYKPDLTSQQRTMALSELDKLMTVIQERSATMQSPVYILEDNSFPSSNYRATALQWQVTDMNAIMAPYAEVNFIALYRDPIAMTFSHPEFDGGIRPHAQVIANFLEYLNGQLEMLGKANYRVVHYEDLMRRDETMLSTLSDYLGIPAHCFCAGFGELRKSGKDWRTQLPPAEQEWLLDFFNRERCVNWLNFLPFRESIG